MKKLLDPNFPFAPKSSPVFYGWVIVAASVIGVLGSLPGQTNGVGVFNDVLIDVTGLKRTHLSWAYCVGTVLSGLNMTKGGRLLDLLGARRMVVLSSCALGLVLIGIAHVDHIIEGCAWLFGFISVSVIAFVVLSALFACLRFSGQGMLVLTSRNVIGKWFNRYRGRASAFAGIAISLAFGLTPTIFQELINAFGWRGAWYILAMISAFGMTFIGWLLFRDNPEECGLQMDGAVYDAATIESQEAAEINYTLDQALRTWSFWLISLTLSLQGLVGTAIPFHIDQFAADHEMTKEMALTLFIPMSVIAPIVGFIAGWACDRYPMAWLLRVMCAFQIVGFIAIAYLGHAFGWYAAVFGLAISGGFFGPLSTVAMPYFFGRRHLGAISGTMMKMMVIGSAIGPLIFAYSHELWQSFMPACIFSAGLALLIFIFASRALKPSQLD